MDKLFLTGATGRIGRAFLGSAVSDQRKLIVATRNPGRLESFRSDAVEECVVGDLSRCDHRALVEMIGDAATIIHMATAIRESGSIDDSETVEMARTVARAAAIAGTPRILLVSSIAASLAEQGSAATRDYGRRKLAAEHAFRRHLAPENHLLILRPPAVYGPGMGGALAILASLVAKGLPLPLGSARAQRDYISLTNLLHLIRHLVSIDSAHWAAANGKVYEPCDGTPASTRDLVTLFGKIQGKKARLVPVPPALLHLAGRLLGKRELVEGAVLPLRATGNAALAGDFGWYPAEGISESFGYLRR